MSIAVIIPSRNVANLVPCMEAVRKHEPGIALIWIDDRHKKFYRSTEDDEHAEVSRAAGLPYINYIAGIRPFVFARNINIGIQAAMGRPIQDHPGAVGAPFDGVILLNDDAILESTGGFSLLAREAEAHPEYGIIGATTNITGQPKQKPMGIGLREVDHFAFVCVFIPRTTIEKIGMLDERFVTYGWDDNDYTHRVRLAGLKVGVHDGCYVDHGSLRSTFRGDPQMSADIEPGRAIFREKWGTA